MRKIVAVLVLVVLTLPQRALGQEKTDERVIAEALSALPQPLRSDAAVKAFRDGGLVTIREGTNGLVCLGDDPAEDGWHVVCYQEELEPFMARGRELRAAGMTERSTIDSVRHTEIEAGKIRFPEGPRALYSLFGDESSFDPATGEAEGAEGLYVIYLPYATEQATGISAVGSHERPWLMYAGTPWAHVMISR